MCQYCSDRRILVEGSNTCTISVRIRNRNRNRTKANNIVSLNPQNTRQEANPRLMDDSTSSTLFILLPTKYIPREQKLTFHPRTYSLPHSFSAQLPCSFLTNSEYPPQKTILNQTTHHGPHRNHQHAIPRTSKKPQSRSPSSKGSHPNQTKHNPNHLHPQSVAAP